MAKKNLAHFPWTYTEGDRLPELPFTYSQNVAGFTAIEAILVRPDGSKIERSLANGGLVVVSSSAQGSKIKINWGATDLLKGLSQLLQIRFVDAGGLALTIDDLAINVKEKHTAQAAP